MPENIFNIVEAPEELDQEALMAVANFILSKLNDSPVEATVAFISDDEMQQLNNQFRSKDHPTDVLSFPIEDDFPTEGITYLGDIAISIDTATRQAEEYNNSFANEIFQLLIHGLIHLNGYDHEEDSGEMDELEIKLRSDAEKYYC